MFNVLFAIVLFVIATLTDVTWAHWTIEVNRGRVVHAGVWATAIVFGSFLGIEAYIHSWEYVFPMAIGAACGTMWATKRKRHE